MVIKWYHKLCVVLILVLVAYAFGRYMQPHKVEYQKEVVEVIKEVKVKDKQIAKKNDRQTKTVITKYPDGKIVKEVYEVNKDVIFLDKKESSKKETETTEKEIKIVDPSKPNWKIQAITTFDISEYGVGVERRILGPIFIGIYGKNTNEYGATLSVEF